RLEWIRLRIIHTHEMPQLRNARRLAGFARLKRQAVFDPVCVAFRLRFVAHPPAFDLLCVVVTAQHVRLEKLLNGAGRVVNQNAGVEGERAEEKTDARQLSVSRRRGDKTHHPRMFIKARAAPVVTDLDEPVGRNTETVIDASELRPGEEMDGCVIFRYHKPLRGGFEVVLILGEESVET